MPASLRGRPGLRYGGLAEWSKAAVLKTVEPRGSRGSNPWPTATMFGSMHPFRVWDRHEGRKSLVNWLLDNLPIGQNLTTDR